MEPTRNIEVVRPAKPFPYVPECMKCSGNTGKEEFLMVHLFSDKRRHLFQCKRCLAKVMLHARFE